MPDISAIHNRTMDVIIWTFLIELFVFAAAYALWRVYQISHDDRAAGQDYVADEPTVVGVNYPWIVSQVDVEDYDDVPTQLWDGAGRRRVVDRYTD